MAAPAPSRKRPENRKCGSSVSAGRDDTPRPSGRARAPPPPRPRLATDKALSDRPIPAARRVATPINPDRIARLQRLGLNEQQARAYLALLDAPAATVHDLSKTSRVPRAKLYEVLESLNRKGLVDVLPETPQRFRANPVSALYDTRVEELRAEEAELKRTVSELAVQFTAQSPERGASSDSDFVHIAHGRTHFAVLARQLIDKAQSSLMIVGDRLVLARLALHEDLARRLAVAATKISVRILVPQNAAEQADGRRVRLDELAPRIRRGSLPPGDALAFVRDREEYVVVRFFPNDLHASRGSDRVEVGRDPEIATLWDRLAGAAWDAAEPWSPARAR